MLKNDIYCSFCGRYRAQVKLLIAGQEGHICESCISHSVEICQIEGIKIEGTSAFTIDYNIIGSKPKFNTTKFTVRLKHCFYLSPFKSPYNEIYVDHVVPIVESENFTIERADEIYGMQPIIEDIWSGINMAGLIIADVTEKNPNVLYEIGVAHAIGKPVLIITQNIDDVPFDLKHYRCLIYDYTPRGCRRLEEEIRKSLTAIKNSNIN